MREECKHLVGRLRSICEGTADMALDDINHHRAKWGMLPLGGLSSAESGNAISTIRTVASGCSGCGAAVAKSTVPTSPTIHPPSILKMGINFTTAMARWAASGFESCPEPIIDQRRSVCDACPLNDNGWCRDCGCLLTEKTATSTEACPAGKWLQYHAPTYRAIQSPKKHLIYHVWPKHPDIWKWNLDNLKRRIDLFDGVRSIGVAIDAETSTLQDVQDYMRDVRVDNWVVVRNDPKIREGATFMRLMATLPKGENDVTFYGHAKGVRHHVGSITLKWADVQYQVCLDDWPSVHAGLDNFPMVGVFKRYGQFKLPKNFQWHYSGTFFWFRNQEVFSSKDWTHLHKTFFACVEAWPANVFDAHEAGCLFGDNVGDLYKDAEFENSVYPRLTVWQAARMNQ